MLKLTPAQRLHIVESLLNVPSKIDEDGNVIETVNLITEEEAIKLLNGDKSE